MIAKDVQIYLNDSDQQQMELVMNAWIQKIVGLDTRLSGQYIIADILDQVWRQIKNDDIYNDTTI